MTVKEAAKILGEALSAEPVVISFNAAKAAYDSDPEVTGMLAEYRTARTLLGELYAKGALSEEEDGLYVRKGQRRILRYDKSTNHAMLFYRNG